MTNAEITTEIPANEVQVGDQHYEPQDNYFHPDGPSIATVQRIEYITEWIDQENREAHYIHFVFGPGHYLTTEPNALVEIVAR